MNKYPRTPHWPTSPAITKNDAYVVENPQAFVGTPVVVTEKIDGCNTKIIRGEATPRSGGRRGSSPWLAMVRKHHAWKTARKPLHFFGEDIYGVHSIEYDPVYEEETFYLFNVSSVLNPTFFMGWYSVTEFAKNLRMKTVPILFEGTFSSVDEINSFIEESMGDPSCLGGEREGVVIRKSSGVWWHELPEGMAKVVRPNHVQTDQHWRKNWKACKIKGVLGAVAFDDDGDEEDDW